MSREIKFRVWSNKVKKFALVNKNYIRFDGQEYASANFDYLLGTEVIEGFSEDEANKEDLVLEQYTGLKDKNGKEIYEGDIVDFNFEKSNTKYQIVWFPGALGFGAKSLTDYEMYKIPLEEIEVVGNIHENPELLGGEE